MHDNSTDSEPPGAPRLPLALAIDGTWSDCQRLQRHTLLSRHCDVPYADSGEPGAGKTATKRDSDQEGGTHAD